MFEPITEKSAEKFLALEGHPLRYNEDTPPFRRLLAIHAEMSVDHAKVNGWSVVNANDVVMDMKNLEKFRRVSGNTALFPAEETE